MDLLKFSVKDFVMTTPFQKWVLHPDGETDGRVKQNPGNSYSPEVTCSNGCKKVFEFYHGDTYLSQPSRFVGVGDGAVSVKMVYHTGEAYNIQLIK